MLTKHTNAVLLHVKLLRIQSATVLHTTPDKNNTQMRRNNSIKLKKPAIVELRTRDSKVYDVVVVWPNKKERAFVAARQKFTPRCVGVIIRLQLE